MWKSKVLGSGIRLLDLIIKSSVKILPSHNSLYRCGLGIDHLALTFCLAALPPLSLRVCVTYYPCTSALWLTRACFRLGYNHYFHMLIDLALWQNVDSRLWLVGAEAALQSRLCAGEWTLPGCRLGTQEMGSCCSGDMLCCFPFFFLSFWGHFLKRADWTWWAAEDPGAD